MSAIFWSSYPGLSPGEGPPAQRQGLSSLAEGGPLDPFCSAPTARPVVERAVPAPSKLRLDRDEADLLRTLAVGALESEDAQQFLARIPTIGELVSSARLVELEAAVRNTGWDGAA